MPAGDYGGVSAPRFQHLSVLVRRHAGDDARIGIETGAMTPWLVHELRNLGLEVVCLDARHARAALKMQINKTDQNDAEGLAQIVRTGWYRSVHVKSLDSHRARAILGARTQLVGPTTSEAYSRPSAFCQARCGVCHSIGRSKLWCSTALTWR
jgi:transposase